MRVSIKKKEKEKKRVKKKITFENTSVQLPAGRHGHTDARDYST